MGACAHRELILQPVLQLFLFSLLGVSLHRCHLELKTASFRTNNSLFSGSCFEKQVVIGNRFEKQPLLNPGQACLITQRLPVLELKTAMFSRRGSLF